jgi:hypothetical protein
MQYYYTKDDGLVSSGLNRTFDSLFRATDEEFSEWVGLLADAVANKWDSQGKPPKGGVALEQFPVQFSRICSVDTRNFWAKDEQTRKVECVADSAKVSIANCFFPNILKAKDSLTETDAVSVYEMYRDLDRRHALYAVLHKAIKADGFYEFSPIYRVSQSFSGDLRRHALSHVQEVLIAEAQGVARESLWVEATSKAERRTPRISGKELKNLADAGLLKPHHHPGVALAEISDNALFRIRRYGIGANAAKVLPAAYRFVELGVGVAPNNFPAGIAKLLYEYALNGLEDQNEYVIYDPSMGFGGRLLAAMSLRDKCIHYVGTDPNTENWIDEVGISRYEYMERTFFSHIRYGESFRGTYICSGSEDVRENAEFKNLKGKLDFVFTSPPYFAAEIYSEEGTQSSIKFSDYDAWRDEFLKPTLQTCVEWLKPKRYLAFNIADVSVGGTQFPLERDLVNILKECGVEFVDRIKMVLAVAPSARVRKDTKQPATKNFCKINGKWRKYEPIFVFYKHD